MTPSGNLSSVFDVLELLCPFSLSHLKNALFCEAMNSLELSAFLVCALCQAESVPGCVEELMCDTSLGFYIAQTNVCFSNFLKVTHGT